MVAQIPFHWCLTSCPPVVRQYVIYFLGNCYHLHHVSFGESKRTNNIMLALPKSYQISCRFKLTSTCLYFASPKCTQFTPQSKYGD